MSMYLFLNYKKYGMLNNTAKLIAPIALALMLLVGCSPSIQPASSVVAEQTPSKYETTAIEQIRQPETPEPAAPVYSPCVQGPEALRFIDSLGFGEAQTLEGAEWQKLIEHMPPLMKQRYISMVQDVTYDALKAHRKITVEGEQLPYWFRHLHEGIAEEYIADCSNQLARLSVAVTQPSMAKIPQAAMVVQLFQSNLEFMKWWLTNCRQKQQMN